MKGIMEPARETRVVAQVDLCVVGGSCTGLFAAVRAARLGLRVAVVEKQNCFGGTACAGLVNVWHSLLDTSYRERVIAGLTEEVEDRLNRAGRICFEEHKNECGARFDPNYLKYELDRLALENKLVVFLNTFYGGIQQNGRRIDAVFIQNKDGRGAIQCGFVIDATGDGDVMRDAGFEGVRTVCGQPPSACFLMTGATDSRELADQVNRLGTRFGLEDDWGWFGPVPGLRDIYFRADHHVFGVDCASAEGLTRAEMEGRAKAYALENLLCEAGGQHRIVALCAAIGVRETVHYPSDYRVTERELLLGQSYDDAILKGTYRVDIHHAQDNGITFKYLDGTRMTLYGKGERCVRGNWREEEGITGQPATYYQMPYRALTQRRVDNLMAAGRMLDAEAGAFGALRVMVNTNQMGEAAGVAAYLSLHTETPAYALDGKQVRRLLVKGGSALD